MNDPTRDENEYLVADANDSQVMALTLVVFDVARSAVWSYPHDDTTSLLTKSTLAAKVIATVSTGILAVVLYHDHRYARQSSIFLSLFLSITTITEGSRTRGFFLRGSWGMDAKMTTVAGLTLGGVIARAILVVMLELPKDLIQHADEKIEPNATVGFWSRSLLIWANSLMVRGYQRQIKMDDLASLAPEIRSQKLAGSMLRVWGTADKEDKQALTKACFRVLFWPILSAWTASMAFAVLYFGSVFILKATLSLLGAPDRRAVDVQGLIGATVLIHSFNAIVQSRLKEAINHLSVMIRGCLTAIMADKATRLPAAAAKKCALLSLMTADINGITDSLKALFELSTAIPSMAVGLYLLWTVIGYAGFLAMVPVVGK